ncbi:MAG: 5-bromo-4-chloroindolyl phosphate hydrolysis family protein, partial [Pseudomonadota bacterium]
MAERFGGKHSPGGATETVPRIKAGPYDGARPSAVGARVNLLFIAPLPLIFSLFGAGATALVINTAALAMLLLSAWLTREGLLAEEAYNARTIAKRPAFPRKSAGSVLMGLGLAAAAYLTAGLGGAIAIGVVGALLHAFAFGLDPLRDKGTEGIDAFQQDRVARVVDEAEDHLKAMARAIEAMGDRALERRLGAFQATARKMFRTVEEDPRDLTGARKFLGVYLMGARDATLKFAELYAKEPREEDRAKYISLLDDLDEN